MTINNEFLSPVLPSATRSMDRQVEQFKKGIAHVTNPEEQSPERLKKVAAEFESIFIAHLMKVMNESVLKTDLFGDGLGGDLYTGMMEEGLANKLAESRGLGLSKHIYEFLQKKGRKVADPVKENSPGKSEFVPPVNGRISSQFGYRIDPFTGATKLHKGTDVAAPEGTPIVASSQGKVVFSGPQGGFGNTVVLEHDGGYRTRYAHLKTNMVSLGDRVQSGQVIGQVGSTGRATGPHLHFEILKENNSLDPKKLL